MLKARSLIKATARPLAIVRNRLVYGEEGVVGCCLVFGVYFGIVGLGVGRV